MSEGMKEPMGDTLTKQAERVVECLRRYRETVVNTYAKEFASLVNLDKGSQNRKFKDLQDNLAKDIRIIDQQISYYLGTAAYECEAVPELLAARKEG